MGTINATETKISTLLSDFKQKSGKRLISGIFNDFHKFTIDKGDYDEKRLIRYLFEGIKDFTVADRPMEKVNWEIPFSFKNYNGSFAHQKFGFRLYLDKKISKKTASLLAEDILEIIEQALILSRQVVKEVGEEKLKKGRIIIKNKLSEIERMYRFFNKEARRRNKRANIPNTVSIKSPPLKNYMNRFKLYEEAKFLTSAAYVAFFSLLEHICILGFAFTGNAETDIYKLCRAKWRDKYKAVFPLEIRDFKQFYDYLDGIAKYRRNPISHGYLGKGNIIFDFYFEPAHHRIPMSLYGREVLYSSTEPTIQSLDHLDSFLTLIKEHPKTRNMMLYLKASLDISYEQDSLAEYKSYMKESLFEAKSYVKYISRMFDDHVNMDW